MLPWTNIAIPVPTEPSALEKTEDGADIQAYEKAAAEYRAAPVTYSRVKVKKCWSWRDEEELREKEHLPSLTGFPVFVIN